MGKKEFFSLFLSLYLSPHTHTDKHAENFKTGYISEKRKYDFLNIFFLVIWLVTWRKQQNQLISQLELMGTE